jgi:hypothetical protein
MAFLVNISCTGSVVMLLKANGSKLGEVLWEYTTKNKL